MKDEVGLYSIVCVRYLDTTQKHWDKGMIHQHSIIVEENDGSYMVRNLTTGIINGWWSKKQLTKIGQIDSIKIVQEIIKNCNQITDIKNKIVSILCENNILCKCGI